MLWRFFISMVTGSSVIDGSHMSLFGSNEHGTSGKKLICVCAFRNMSEPKKKKTCCCTVGSACVHDT